MAEKRDRSHERARQFDPLHRRPEMDRKWSPELADAVLEIIASTGSPKRAAEELGISASLIHVRKRQDPEFGARYMVAMDEAFQNVLGHAFTRAYDDVKPSDRLTEVLLKLRWPERLGNFISVGSSGASGGLDPMVIARMPPEDRSALINLLERYQEVAGDLALDVEAHGDTLLLA